VAKIELTKEIKESIDKSVLCWLATVSAENMPNVSPKEIFNYFGTDKVIIANIASPQTVCNIKSNENVCISFIDILLQKGFQIKGKAEIIDETDTEFLAMEKILSKMTEGKFPFKSITKITIAQVKRIIAPKYILYPETTEIEQIENAKKVYGI
jgi:predicted pyridoxine 5'-phosphate oxidase superfamily flavin-nucleotide-binding protein